MAQDLVRELGYLCLGSRLKRLGERLQTGVQQASDGSGPSLQPGLFPILAALHRDGPCTVSSLAEALGVAQPGVTRSLAKLADLGFARMSRGAEDQRQRVAELTESGRKVIRRAEEELWPRVEAAVRSLCEPLGGSLLDQISAIEEALAEKPLHERIAEVRP
ncbi:MAG TPA: MarR family transcriptional regulator [Allosphingosinicella sp.]|uniref:MarR family winged helix-turn-helix transcriptional regulator n=1 Tax=Allosphingosinicella sp. TaxID=2823234 RepID=UPI002EDB45C4